MQENSIVQTIKKRRSIRNYTSEPIPERDLYEIISSGIYAPSGKNRQPWRFVIVKDKNKIRQIAKSTTYSRFIRNAPVLLLVYLTPATDYPIEKDMLGLGACIQNILLTATERGFGTCVIGELYSVEFRAFDLNCSNYKLICGICLGKSNVKEQKKKKSLNDFIIKCI